MAEYYNHINYFILVWNTVSNWLFWHLNWFFQSQHPTTLGDETDISIPFLRFELGGEIRVINPSLNNTLSDRIINSLIDLSLKLFLLHLYVGNGR